MQREEEKNTESSGGIPSLPELAAQLVALERRVAELEQVNLHRVTGTTGPLPAVKHKPTSDDLPDNLVSYPMFARLHGISVSTVQKAIDANRLTVIRGRWKQGQAIVQKALDANGRARFVELFQGNEHFKVCSECPHQ